MSENITRKKHTGEPGNGGQFGTTVKGEPAGLSVGTVDKSWGETGVVEGSRTPWGRADWVEQIAPGITSVSTVGHGGIKLSSERNKVVPSALRNSNGWYEEDCEALIPEMTFAREFTRPNESVDEAQARFDQGVRDWFPSQYERAFGVELARGESVEKDRMLRAVETKANHVGVAAWGAGQEVDGFEVPDGKVLVLGKRAVDGDGAYFLVDKDRYSTRDGGYVVDLAVDTEVHEIVERQRRARQEQIDNTKPATTLLPAKSSADHERSERALDQQWRDSDTGRIYTLREDIAAGRFHGKQSLGSGRSKSYYLNVIAPDGGPGNSLIKIPKSLYDIYDAPVTEN